MRPKPAHYTIAHAPGKTAVSLADSARRLCVFECAKCVMCVQTPFYRRKEENMIKKSIGFNWGPCAVSTSYWTGVPLRDLLLKAGVKTPRDGAK